MVFGISAGTAGSAGSTGVGTAGGAFGTVGAFLGAMTISPLVDVTGDLKPDGELSQLITKRLKV